MLSITLTSEVMCASRASEAVSPWIGEASVNSWGDDSDSSLNVSLRYDGSNAQQENTFSSRISRFGCLPVAHFLAFLLSEDQSLKNLAHNSCAFELQKILPCELSPAISFEGHRDYEDGSENIHLIPHAMERHLMQGSKSSDNN
jgi:hypothetical protein